MITLGSKVLTVTEDVLITRFCIEACDIGSVYTSDSRDTSALTITSAHVGEVLEQEENMRGKITYGIQLHKSKQ